MGVCVLQTSNKRNTHLENGYGTPGQPTPQVPGSIGGEFPPFAAVPAGAHVDGAGLHSHVGPGPSEDFPSRLFATHSLSKTSSGTRVDAGGNAGAEGVQFSFPQPSTLVNEDRLFALLIVHRAVASWRNARPPRPNPRTHALLAARILSQVRPTHQSSCGFVHQRLVYHRIIQHIDSSLQ
jgi:hypothetical protein